MEMEDKAVISILGVLAGVCMTVMENIVGCRRMSNQMSDHQKIVMEELMKLVIDGKDSGVTFNDFPYFLSEKVKILLTSAGYVHLTQHRLSKHTRNLSPISQSILLSGPAEFYQEKLAKALAHYFESKLLVLDVNYFSSALQKKYGCPTKEPVSSTTAPLKCTNSFCFDENRFLDSLYKVLVFISESDSVILYIKDVEKIFLQSRRMYRLFQNLLSKLSGSVLVLGSRTYDSEDKCTEVGKILTTLFPCNIEIKLPQDKTRLKIWKDQLEEAVKNTQLEDNRNLITKVLAANDIECDDLNSIVHKDIMKLSDLISEIAASAIFYQLMDNKNPEYRNGKLIISAKSLCHVLKVFQEGESIEKDKKESNKENPPDNAYEELIRQELVPASEIKVTFSDIGALDDVKESLQEAVMLPLRRPDLFKGDGVLKPCKGVLLFGPPGTGKTMLAKAIANEAGASFINVSASTITDPWLGQSEKTVRALFSLAAKVAPTVIFVDEIDSMLAQRGSNSESDTMRSIKNEFMSHWDGLLSKPDERIIVLGATNMPFDLDEAVIRRFQRRIMVGLPSAENREMILKTILAAEKHEDIDFKELSTMTEGYSGSDLKNLCTTAAYRPVKELLKQEKDNQVVSLRPLNMEDLRQAKNKVTASFAAEGSMMNILKEWNDIYGEGGSGKKEAHKQLSYYI